MSRSETRAMLEAERSELAHLLTTLEADAWETQSLCADWTVLEVAAHLASAVGVTRRGLMARALRYGSGTDGANARSAKAWAAKGQTEITRLLSDPKRLGLGFFHGQWALCETVVHHQDIRRVLDMPRTIPADRTMAALDVLRRMPFLTGASRASRRVTIRPNDIDWSWGAGPDVSGPAESILMAMAGRADARDELAGPGRDILC